MIRVLVVRDGDYFGIQVRVLLSSQPDIDVAGTVPMDHDVVLRAVPYAPDVLVIDTQLMVSQVLPAAQDLRARLPHCHILVLCDPTKPGMLPPRRHADDVSFLLKDASPAYLADSVRKLAAGERIVHPRLQAASMNTERGLSTRELTVLGLAAEGDSVDDIAKRLFLSGGTVRNYLSAVIYKTGARNRLDAIRIVRRDGWLR
ncbi:response regulator transcription factor [Actinoplanes sp. TFC3]|uniref:response regulator transcription factor n=1 Tax=Actinoplanes sp. TFC3 TaxID=1710355 RepID=UPI000836AA70|nr:response regulator transcription factor [Actinoplanes sp. TFC3]